MVDMHWQVQQVKQRLSEVLRAAESGGPQFVTRHGQDVAVVISIEDYHRMNEKPEELTRLLVDGPGVYLSDEEVDTLFARDRGGSTRAIPFVGPDWE